MISIGSLLLGFFLLLLLPGVQLWCQTGLSALNWKKNNNQLMFKAGSLMLNFYKRKKEKNLSTL